MVWVWLGVLATRDFRTPSSTSPPSNSLHLVFLLLPLITVRSYIFTNSADHWRISIPWAFAIETSRYTHSAIRCVARSRTRSLAI